MKNEFSGFGSALSKAGLVFLAISLSLQCAALGVRAEERTTTEARAESGGSVVDLARLNDQLAKSPDSIDLLIKRGDYYLDQLDPYLAAQDYRKALSCNPEMEAPAVKRLGQAAKDLRDISQTMDSAPNYVLLGDSQADATTSGGVVEGMDASEMEKRFGIDSKWLSELIKSKSAGGEQLLVLGPSPKDEKVFREYCIMVLKETTKDGEKYAVKRKEYKCIPHGRGSLFVTGLTLKSEPIESDVVKPVIEGFIDQMIKSQKRLREVSRTISSKYKPEEITTAYNNVSDTLRLLPVSKLKAVIPSFEVSTGDDQKDKDTVEAMKDKLRNAGLTVVSETPKDCDNYGTLKIMMKVVAKAEDGKYACMTAFGFLQVVKNEPLPGTDYLNSYKVKETEEARTIALSYVDEFLREYNKAKTLLAPVAIQK